MYVPSEIIIIEIKRIQHVPNTSVTLNDDQPVISEVSGRTRHNLLHPLYRESVFVKWENAVEVDKA